MEIIKKNIDTISRFLRSYSIKISYSTIVDSLENPLGNPLRGISDLLDSLAIRHKVYKVPTGFMEKFTEPVLAFSTNNKICIIDRKSKACDSLSETVFVLLPEMDGNYIEPFFYFKQLKWYIERYLFFCSLFLLGLIFFLLDSSSSINRILNIITFIGLVFSFCILYKETYDNHFLNKFCKVGQIIDCNKVLNSRYSKIGSISFANLSSVYFFTIFLAALFNLPGYYDIVKMLSCAGVVVAFWSIIYQAFVIRSFCLFCSLIDVVLICECIITIFTGFSFNIHYSYSFIILCLIACFCGLCVIGYNKLVIIRRNSKKYFALKGKILGDKVLFDTLLEHSDKTIMPEKRIVISSSLKDNNVFVILGLRCSHCGSFFLNWSKKRYPINIVFSISSNDQLASKICLAIISCYIKNGPEQAIKLLLEWYSSGDPSFVNNIQIVDESYQILKGQISYCEKITPYNTPCILIKDRILPPLFETDDLFYVKLN